MRNALRTENLVKSYRKRRVVDGISLQVRRGEVVGFLGPNGAGKTTSFHMMVGLLMPDEGRIFLDGEDVTDLPMYQRARKGIGYLPQESSVFRKLSVEKNLMAILELLHLEREERIKRLEKLLSELKISHLRHQMAYTLSGGERRRVEIARALVTSPSFILLDEPFTGIDPIAVADIQQIISELKEKGFGILITDHNVRETLEITNRAYIMYEGRIPFSGVSQDLATSKEARKLYLGEKFRL